MNELLILASGGAVISMADTIEASADEAFERSLEERYLGLLRLATLVAGNRADAEDALQAGLEHAWRSRRQLRDLDALDGWLRTIVVREVVRRQTSPWRRLVRSTESFETPLDVPDRDEDVDLRLALAAALRRLPVPQRAAVVLHHYAGYPVAEVAAVLGVPLETARSRLRIAMDRLRKELGE